MPCTSGRGFFWRISKNVLTSEVLLNLAIYFVKVFGIIESKAAGLHSDFFHSMIAESSHDEKRRKGEIRTAQILKCVDCNVSRLRCFDCRRKSVNAGIQIQAVREKHESFPSLSVQELRAHNVEHTVPDGRSHARRVPRLDNRSGG